MTLDEILQALALKLYPSGISDAIYLAVMITEGRQGPKAEYSILKSRRGNPVNPNEKPRAVKTHHAYLIS